MIRSFGFASIIAALLATPALADYDLPDTMSAAIPATPKAEELGPLFIGNGKIIFQDGRSVKLTSMKPTKIPKGMVKAYLLMDAPPSNHADGTPICSQPMKVYVLQVTQVPSSQDNKTILTFRGAPDGTFTSDSPVCEMLAYDGIAPLKEVTLDPSTRDLATADAPAEASADMPAPEESAASSSPGKWNVSVSKNPLDDTKRVVLRLDADSGQSRYGKGVTFLARCQSNKTEAYVIWNDYLGDDSSRMNGWKNVTYRIGDHKAKTARWDISTDHEATFVPDWAGDFLKQMLDQDKLVLQVTPYNESPITAVFDIRGLRAVLPKLADTCNWTF